MSTWLTETKKHFRHSPDLLNGFTSYHVLTSQTMSYASKKTALSAYFQVIVLNALQTLTEKITISAKTIGKVRSAQKSGEEGIMKAIEQLQQSVESISERLAKLEGDSELAKERKGTSSREEEEEEEDDKDYPCGIPLMPGSALVAGFWPDFLPAVMSGAESERLNEWLRMRRIVRRQRERHGRSIRRKADRIEIGHQVSFIRSDCCRNAHSLS